MAAATAEAERNRVLRDGQLVGAARICRVPARVPTVAGSALSGWVDRRQRCACLEKAQAGTYGVDRDHIALGGGSSGGQMAALLAYTSNTSLFKTHANDDTRVNALFDLDGVLNFTSAGAQFENAAGDASPAALWLGVGGARRGQVAGSECVRACGCAVPADTIISSGAPRFTAGKDEVLANSNATRHSSPVPRTRECSAHLLALRAAPEQGGR